MIGVFMCGTFTHGRSHCIPFLLLTGLSSDHELDQNQIMILLSVVVVVVVLLFYVHGKHLRSCRDGQLT